MIENDTQRPRTKMASDYVPDEVVSPKLSVQTTRTTSKLLKSLNVSDNVEFGSSMSSNQILGALYSLMVKIESNKQKMSELEYDKIEERDNEDLRRHQELIKALTVRRVKVQKKKEQEPTKEEKKKEESETPKDQGLLSNVTEKGKQFAEKLKEKLTGKKTPSTKPPAPPATTTPPSVTPAPRSTLPTTTAKPPSPVSGTSVVPSIAKSAAGAATIGASVDALAKIKGSEGFRTRAYPDPKRDSSGKPIEEHYSVGYGHQITKEEIKNGHIKVGNKKVPVVGKLGEDTVITKEDADALVKQDFEKYEKYATSLPNYEKLNRSAQIALLDMSYNMGVGWMSEKRWPSLRKQLTEMDLQGAANNIRNSLYAKQVKDRALANADAIQNGVNNLPPTNVPAPNNIGVTIDNSSKENKQLREEMKQKSKPQNVMNQTNISVSQTNRQETDKNSGSDMSAYERKSKNK